MMRVWLIEIKLPTGILLWFYESKAGEFCLTYQTIDATHFKTRLAAEEFLLNIKYLNQGLEPVQNMYVTEHEIKVAQGY